MIMQIRHCFQRNKWFRRSAVAALSGLLFLLIALWYANHTVTACRDDIYHSADQIPEREYGLLLGTSKLIAGKRSNSYFDYRIEAAAALYRAGKVRKIIVSGDNSRKNYNEPADMRRALREAGVKAEDIFPDYAGFRTLDSVLRAKNVFGVSKYTVISQQFHCERAIFIARHHGIDAIGFAAREVSPRFRIKRFLREPLSRLMACLDVNILHRKPHFER